MGSSLLITLREGLEIALVLAIIVAYLVKTGRGDRLPAVWAGVAVAAVTCVAAGIAFRHWIGEFEGRSEQLIEGVLALAAAAVLTWMIFWMRGHSRGVRSELHARIDAASWPQPRLMSFLQAQGNIEPAEMARTFNCGIGMVLAVAADDAAALTNELETAGETVFMIGAIEPGERGCTVQGDAEAWSARETWEATHLA